MTAKPSSKILVQHHDKENRDVFPWMQACKKTSQTMSNGGTSSIKRADKISSTNVSSLPGSTRMLYFGHFDLRARLHQKSKNVQYFSYRNFSEQD